MRGARAFSLIGPDYIKSLFINIICFKTSIRGLVVVRPCLHFEGFAIPSLFSSPQLPEVALASAIFVVYVGVSF